jgi:phosphoglycolate phosphatase-like HAD superfamily hydrolase
MGTAGSHIILWDIDGTLLRTNGAGSLAMNRAFEWLFGVPEALAPIDIAGRSDLWILRATAAHHGFHLAAEAVSAFIDCYAEALAETLPARGGRVLPGVAAVLEHLAQAGVVQGLGTGNFRRTAAAKLAHFGIGAYFREGGFGDDAAERPSILAAGVARLRPWAAAEAEVVVVGDTVHDVTAARAIGARVVAVSTGSGRLEDLQAAGADVILADCAHLERTVEALLG